MRLVSKNYTPAKEVSEYMEKLEQGEVEPLHLDQKPFFITEEMEKELLAKGETWASEPPPRLKHLIETHSK